MATELEMRERLFLIATEWAYMAALMGDELLRYRERYG